MGYPGPNCSRSLANRQPANQWLPANHSPASSRLGGQALAVGDGERIACRQAARPGGGRPGRLNALLHRARARARLYRATRSPSMPLRPQYSLAMTRSSGWQCEGYRQTHTGTTTSRAVAHHHVAQQQVMTRGVLRKVLTLVALPGQNRVRTG